MDTFTNKQWKILATFLKQRQQKNAVLTTTVFIGTIDTIFFAVTEKTTVDTVFVSARQLSIGAQWLCCYQKWYGFALFVLGLTVFHCLFPVTCLFFNVEKKTSWTTNGLKTLSFVYFQCRNRTKNTKNQAYH